MTLKEFLDEWNDGRPTLLVHTSGSTGEPKPMWVEKTKMLNSAHITCDFLGLKGGDTALLCMPLDYIARKMVVVRAIERHLRLIDVKPCGHPLADGVYPIGEPMRSSRRWCRCRSTTLCRCHGKGNVCVPSAILSSVEEPSMGRCRKHSMISQGIYGAATP